MRPLLRFFTNQCSNLSQGIRRFFEWINNYWIGMHPRHSNSIASWIPRYSAWAIYNRLMNQCSNLGQGICQFFKWINNYWIGAIPRHSNSVASWVPRYCTRAIYICLTNYCSDFSQWCSSLIDNFKIKLWNVRRSAEIKIFKNYITKIFPDRETGMTLCG